MLYVLIGTLVFLVSSIIFLMYVMFRAIMDAIRGRY